MPVRIALLGTGFVAGFYMQGLRDVPDQEVRVAYGRDPGRARAFADRWRIPEVVTDMRAAVEREDVDLVIIGLPNFLHRDAALLAAAATARSSRPPVLLRQVR